MGEKEIQISYADVVIIAENVNNLPRQIKQFEETAIKYNMMISIEKRNQQ